MRRKTKVCECNQGNGNSKSAKFEINGSMIELKCNKCNGLIGWWNRPEKKITPYKRAWSDVERLAMRLLFDRL